MKTQQIPAGYGYLSSTLKGAGAHMSESDRHMALDCFNHWRSEWERLRNKEPERVAFTIHEVVDERIAHMRATSKYAPEIKCQKGCAACCHVHIDMFPHEAVLLLKMAEEMGIEIDWDRLERQAPKDSETWRELSPEDKRCVFLDDDRNCRVYEHRPGSCRKYLVLSDPAQCDMEKNPGAKVGIVFDVQAEIVHSAAMTAYGGGNMATVLLQHKPKA